MRCRDCANHYTKDHGYSNYTVEGTDIGCMLVKNPAFPVDYCSYEPPSEAEAFADSCPDFTVGEGESFCVEDTGPELPAS